MSSSKHSKKPTMMCKVNLPMKSSKWLVRLESIFSKIIYPCQLASCSRILSNMPNEILYISKGSLQSHTDILLLFWKRKRKLQSARNVFVNSGAVCVCLISKSVECCQDNQLCWTITSILSKRSKLWNALNCQVTPTYIIAHLNVHSNRRLQ